MKDFEKLFNFDSSKRLFVGAEREGFLRRGGVVSPIADEVLRGLNDGRFTYELSRCQLEDRTKPVELGELGVQLRINDGLVKKASGDLDFERVLESVGPEDMPLDVYPDPTGRYQKIVKKMPREVLSAACRIAATHIHVGVGSFAEALLAYNFAVDCFYELSDMGDITLGERLRLYSVVSPVVQPRKYERWDDYYECAIERGFVDDPRKCWDLIRISPNGTIEFRMFDVTCNNQIVCLWAKRCYEICRTALE